MRYILIPETVELVNLGDDTPAGRKMAFKEFLGNMLIDPKFGRTAGDIFAAADIRQKLKETGGEPGAVLELADSDWEKLAAVIKEPSNGYAPIIMLQVPDFLRCILDAPTKKPESK